MNDPLTSRPDTGAPGGMTGFANPSVNVTLTAQNGTAVTAMRSDAAPALSQAITPTWTGKHTWTGSQNGGYATMVLSNTNTGTNAGNEIEWKLQTVAGSSAQAATLTVSKSDTWATTADTDTNLLFSVSGTSSQRTYLLLNGNGDCYLQVPAPSANTSPFTSQRGYSVTHATPATAGNEYWSPYFALWGNAYNNTTSRSALCRSGWFTQADENPSGLPTAIAVWNLVASDSLTTDSVNPFRLTSLGSVILGDLSALNTSATDGFTYIPTCAGTPTGTPTTYTGKVAFIYDTTNEKLYVYNGSWKSVTLA